MGLFGGRKKKEAACWAMLDAESCLKENFQLTVDDAFALVGRGTTVTGTVTSGMCREGEAAAGHCERDIRDEDSCSRDS